MTPANNDGYRDDLAYIHDAGFGGFARDASSWLLAHFASQGIRQGLVIDLGCGSGIWAAALAGAGYEVLGYDLSPSMVKLAKRRVPAGRFVATSLLDAELPRCVAVTALGEIFNYLFDERNSARSLYQLFARVYAALAPGGLFVFDGAEPGRGGKSGHTSNYTLGEDWACLYAGREDRRLKTLTRDITTFRKQGQLYRRDHEVHTLRLFDRREMLARLRACGFRARVIRAYGEHRFPPGYLGVVARKAAQ